MNKAQKEYIHFLLVFSIAGACAVGILYFFGQKGADALMIIFIIGLIYVGVWMYYRIWQKLGKEDEN